MSGPRGRLQLVAAPEDRAREAGGEAGGPIDAELVHGPGPAGRRFAAHAPASPGTVPLELARQLRPGEPVIWWNHKAEISWWPVVWVGLASLVVLGLATLFAPEMWRAPLSEQWKTLAPVLAPALLLGGREWLSRRAVLVTDNSVVVLDHRGRPQRLAFRNVRRVRRDLLTGGILLEGAEVKLRLPPQLAEDAREAIASQTQHAIRGQGEGPDDPLGWLPW
ncbi:hypothetical protein G6O69_19450 [Pseudenhygromyxa sp. WMMC2535]|uniref:hypothetical protein n=1 Tax=Pseudenhygromyxa sp. WMMC2535 TaxID=2712867 RepID=UPI0015555C51|nr:hypothetical protein [Pseudenhygromyxa sp. WMMC2535]NVB40030.1 hypothetical protein [Pseudenhygromyxa sp. WMMC2535]